MPIPPRALPLLRAGGPPLQCGVPAKQTTTTTPHYKLGLCGLAQGCNSFANNRSYQQVDNWTLLAEKELHNKQQQF
jgi:hypothetical protein